MKKVIIIGALLALCAAGTAATAQPAPSTAGAQASNQAVGAIVQDTRRQIKAVAGPGGAAGLSAEQRASIRAVVASARMQVAAAGATRQQIQAIRAALRIKVAALRH